MAKRYLLSVVETYRVESEAAAAELIEEAKSDSHFTLSKYTNQYRERKQKGEVVDSWHKVTLTKTFTDEKEPVEEFEVSYTNGAF